MVYFVPAGDSSGCAVVHNCACTGGFGRADGDANQAFLRTAGADLGRSKELGWAVIGGLALISTLTLRVAESAEAEILNH